MGIFLVVSVALLLIVTLVQVLRVGELIGKSKDQDINEVTDQDNKLNGILFLITIPAFLGFVIWQMIKWNDFLLPSASSLHGSKIDDLMAVSMGLILIVFFILTPILFFFAYKYRGKTGNKAYYFSHNNKLEITWTIVPTIILTVLIIYGLKTWDEVMNQDHSDAIVVEIFSEQFAWRARYAGTDKVLGPADYRLITDENPLGVITTDNITKRISILKEEYLEMDSFLLKFPWSFTKDSIKNRMSENLKLQKDIPNLLIDYKDQLKYVYDDKEIDLAKGKVIYLPVNKKVLFKFRSRDVIHSAFIPHMRVQMNCVPGMTTQFAFTPTRTTKEMRKDPKIIKQMKIINQIREDKRKETGSNDPKDFEFDYVLMCNKICGASHFAMKMIIKVVSQEEYDEWINNPDSYKSFNTFTLKQ